ncbi:DUF1090 domain-containing protein [Pantoea sp.]|uniref:DUF1090 domain-containing protein n=1 Tax=Pantoea sp. TaxID=69393 RepID=UPI00289C2239|nr:DUF1090 domain-containing protein [Pantoea sp.]
MKKSVLTLTVALLLSSIGMAQASIESCATKQAALEKEIRIAQQYGNSAKVNSLKKALAEVKAHCTNSSVTEDAQKKIRKLESKVSDKQRDIQETQSDLREAQAKGDMKKVEKYQRKLAEKQADLREAEAELNQARAALAALR